MKTIKIYLLVLCMISATSCGDEFLQEKPLDFLSTENAFLTTADFQASINSLYSWTRGVFYNYNDNDPMDYLYRTDIAWNVSTGAPNLDADFGPSSGIVSRNWERLYKIVSEANTIISRIPKSNLSDSDKLLFEARGKFFRAFGYRALAYLFGGVPLVTEEITSPKVDFTRATRQEVYAQIISDLTFATQNLPAITAVNDGEVSNLAAYHLLAEVYLADGQFQNAVNAATVVIDDPNTDLMTQRFGSRSTLTPGDVYWDLFQRGNQNRKTSGNKESIWVMQFETDVIGGGSVSTAFNQSFQLERVHPPLVRDFIITDGNPNTQDNPFLWPAGDYTGGRGVGFMAPSTYFINNVYQSDFNNDIRNANHNFVRKFKANNPKNPYFGQEIDFHNLPAGSKNVGTPVASGQISRALYPYQTKATTPFDHPSPLYITPAPYPFALKNSAGGTYADQYVFRLAETYLIRAEAYLGLGNTSAAAADINLVRARSNAAAITGAQVDIDFILDERIRELGLEEKRMLTLMRLGKLYDRIIKCNPVYAATIQPKHNLWPIPQGQIERNRGAELAQNPGY
jgi:starch-binding outer membrane protein, SusD/RagB family